MKLEISHLSFNSMSITVADISKLREITGAGMMDCKKALEEANGDLDAAGELLRKKGIVKAAKRADKISAEGLSAVETKGVAAVALELNTETDFAAGSDDFKKLLGEITQYLLDNKPASLEDGVAGVQDKISAAVAKIGEKITLRRFTILEKGEGEAFGVYVHLGGKTSVLILLSGTTDENLAREVAMQVAAASPKYVERSEVPSVVLDKEKEIFVEQLKTQGKPQNIIENILKGKMEKYYSEVCLPEQAYIKDEEKTVQKFLDSQGAGIKIKKFVRYEVGEGIEKKACDFATEVVEQLK